jgi:hypothetical protein
MADDILDICSGGDGVTADDLALRGWTSTEIAELFEKAKALVVTRAARALDVAESRPSPDEALHQEAIRYARLTGRLKGALGVTRRRIRHAIEDLRIKRARAARDELVRLEAELARTLADIDGAAAGEDLR